jgi:hypothetical protein
MVQSWIEELKSLPWWDTETAWGKKSDPIWFVKPDDTEGYFLVDANDTYVVYPELSYQIDDQGYDGSWWLEKGYPVENSQGRIIRDKDPLTVPIDSPTCDC